MAERILIAIAIALLATLAVLAVRAWVNRRRRSTIGISAPNLATAGHATVLYFYSDTCEPCRTVQKPELDRLVQNTTNVIVRAIDAVAAPELARAFKVLPVPTTVVLGPRGTVAAVNYGVARVEKLVQQISAA